MVTAAVERAAAMVPTEMVTMAAVATEVTEAAAAAVMNENYIPH